MSLVSAVGNPAREGFSVVRAVPSLCAAHRMLCLRRGTLNGKGTATATPKQRIATAKVPR